MEEPPFLREARFSGSWRVEAVAVFRRRTDALVAAAACSALATRCHLSLNTDGREGSSRRRLGFPLHDGQEHIGHLARPEEELLPYLRAVRCLVASPEAMSLALAAMASPGSQSGRTRMQARA